MKSLFPQDLDSAITEHYGEPGTNIVRVELPYAMRLHWDPTKQVTSLLCNSKVADSLSAIFVAIADRYDEAAREKLRLNRLGTSYAMLRNTVGAGLARHSWGIAIELDPERHAYGKSWRSGAGMLPLEVVSIFQEHGWRWGNSFGRRPRAGLFQATS